MAIESRLEIRLVAESKDALIFAGQSTKKCRVEQQWVITIVINILILNPDARIVISVKDRLARLEHRHALPMNYRRVEQESGSGRTFQFNTLRHRQSLDLGALQVVRMLLQVRSFEEIKRAAAHIC